MKGGKKAAEKPLTDHQILQFLQFVQKSKQKTIDFLLSLLSLSLFFSPESIFDIVNQRQLQKIESTSNADKKVDCISHQRTP